MAILPTGNGTVTPGPLQEQVVCGQTNWYDLVWFYFANYVLHALSVRSLPGENTLSSAAFKFCCLLIPYTGLRRGLCLIARASNLDGHRLQAAARANALCMVIRNEDWRPENGEVVPNCRIQKPTVDTQTHVSEGNGDMNCCKEVKHDDEKVDPISCELKAVPTTSATSFESGTGKIGIQVGDSYEPIKHTGIFGRLFAIFVQTYRFRSLKPTSGKRLDLNTIKIHGLCKLAPGYSLTLVPEDIKVSERIAGDDRPRLITAIRSGDLTGTRQAILSQTRVATANNIPRILFSLMQTVSGGYSLYRAQGRQIAKFGFAAYGLTVLPYVIVSIFNVCGSLLTAEYEMLYVVHSSMMDEMVRRGGIVDGVIGTVDSEAPEIDLRVQDLEQTGLSLEFECEGDTLRYREIGVKRVFTEPLTVTSMPPPQPIGVYTAFYRSSGGDRLRKWLRSKRKKKMAAASTDQSKPTTIVTIPSHGALARLPVRAYQPVLNGITVILLVLALVTPFLVNYGLTRFKANESTSNQRSFIMNWLVEGIVLGYVVGSMEKLNGTSKVVKGMTVMFLCYGCYCIMGFVAVAQEMLDLGTCTSI